MGCGTPSENAPPPQNWQGNQASAQVGLVEIMFKEVPYF